jgi:hypothetical protein
MKLDRNIQGNDGWGKYALIKLRSLQTFIPGNFEDNEITRAVDVLDKAGLIEWGRPETEGEFFVIKLRDAFAEPALVMYANTAMMAGEKDYAHDVKELADRSGGKSPFSKLPD